MAKNYNISATLEVINRFTKPIQEFKQQIKGVSEPIRQAQESINNSLNGTRSKVASLASQYRSMGMSASEAMKKAWREVNHTKKTIDNTKNSANGLVGSFKSLSFHIGSIMGLKGLINTSDMMTNLHSRLNLMNDGLQTTDELQEKIFQSAQNSRGAYQDMAEMVAKLGVNAKDAFSSNDQIVKFGENMNKIFKLGGASSAEQSAGMLQLTQALASGKLQGDEFRSITENAPELIGILAEKLGKTRSEIKEMSTAGELTSDVIVKSVIDSTDKINSQFATMPLTWSDVWTNIKNTTLKATQPILSAINYVVNTESFKQLQKKFDEFANYVSTTVIPKVQEKLPIIKQKLTELLALINKYKPVLIGVASAFVAFKGINTAIKAINGFKTALKGLSVLTSPIGLVAIAIGAVVAALIYAYKHSETFRNIVNSAVESVKEKFETFRARVQLCLEAIQQFLERHKEEVNSVKEFINSVIELIISILSTCVSTIGSMLSGLVTMVTGMVDMVRGIFDGQWKDVWEGFKEVVKGAIDVVKGWWNGMLDLFKKPIDFTVNLFKKDQSENETVSNEQVGHNATGTRNWKGGLTWVGEKGAELINLPKGSQVYTHEESMDMLSNANGNKGISISIGKIAEHLEVKNDMDIKQIGRQIGNSIIDTLYNAGFNY